MSGPFRARIIRGQGLAGATGVEPMSRLLPSSAWRRRVAREEIVARLEAERIVMAAVSEAEAVVSRARANAADLSAQMFREACEQAEAKLAAQWLMLRRAEDERLERDRDRIIAVATVLAERLLGTALELEPSRVLDLARVAMAEARGARRITIEAHPLDADTVRDHLEAAGLSGAQGGRSPRAIARVEAGVDGRVDVRSDETLARGELRLQTDVGTVDAKLSPRLERLAAALRDALP